MAYTIAVALRAAQENNNKRSDNQLPLSRTRVLSFADADANSNLNEVLGLKSTPLAQSERNGYGDDIPQV